MGSLLVLAMVLTMASIGPSAIRAAPPSAPQAPGGSPSDSIREAAQWVTQRYIEGVEDERDGGTQWLAARFAQGRRPDLIRSLDRLGQAAPEDDWIVGHRVGFRILDGQYNDALRVARECRAASWWCAQLTGLVLQILEEFPRADSAFAVAFAKGPPEHGCEMRDISPLLDRRTESRYERMDCEERTALEERFWWLADPLHLQRGNARRTEHWARTTSILLHDQLLRLVGGSCSIRGVHGQTVVRTGWPEQWWSHAGDWRRQTHVSGYAFVPHADALADPLRVTADDWHFDPSALGERYDHPNGPVYPIDHQVAFFQRGDSAAVVGAIDLRSNPVFLRGALDAGLVLTRDPHDPGITVRESGLEPRYLFRAIAPAERHLVSVEVITEGGGFGRARFGDGLPEPGPGGLALSSVLLFEGAGSVEEDLDAVAPLALGTTRVPSGQSVGLYWEVYGFGAADELEIALRVQREEGRGLFRRLARAVRLVDSTEPVILRWQEQLETEGFLSRVLDFDISNLEPGRYTIELEARAGSHGPAASQRRFEVVPSGS